MCELLITDATGDVLGMAWTGSDSHVCGIWTSCNGAVLLTLDDIANLRQALNDAEAAYHRKHDATVVAFISTSMGAKDTD